MKIVQDILKGKGFQVFTISPRAKVYDALMIMAEKNVGALMVVENDTIVGMISERDYARNVIQNEKFSKDVPVSDIMTTHIIRVSLYQDIESCMGLMTDKHVRHLPVLENDHIIGIISIGDIVKAIIEHKEEIINQLENYIKGKR